MSNELLLNDNEEKDYLGVWVKKLMFFERVESSQYYCRVIRFYRYPNSSLKLRSRIVIDSFSAFLSQSFGDSLPSSSIARDCRQNSLELMAQSFHPNHDSKKVSYAR